MFIQSVGVRRVIVAVVVHDVYGESRIATRQHASRLHQNSKLEPELTTDLTPIIFVAIHKKGTQFNTLEKSDVYYFPQFALMK